eukprot:gene4159-3000_t
MSVNKFKLYLANFCPYCQKAEITAKEKKMKYEREEIDIHGTVPEFYKKLNPSETVPTLVVDGSKIVLESNLVAQYFDTASSPSGALMGANAMERQRIELFMSQVSQFIGAARAVLQDPFNAAKRATLEERIAYIDGLFAEHQISGPFFLDDKFSFGDICVLPFLHQFRHTLGYYAGYDVFAKAPHLKRMYAEAIKRESVKSTFLPAEENIEHSAYLMPENSPFKKAGGGHVIFNNPFTPFGDRVRLAANIKGFKHTNVEINLQDIPEWLKFYNPRETVPMMMAPNGEPVHESNNIVQYIDQVQGSQGRVLLPRDNAEKQYAVQYFIAMTDNLSYGFGQTVATREAADSLAELKWAATELEKLLQKKTFGDGPFLGGQHMNAGDIALLPILVRINAIHPEILKYNFFAEFKLLDAMMKAGVAAPESKGVFLDNAMYVKALKFHFKIQTTQISRVCVSIACTIILSMCYPIIIIIIIIIIILFCHASLWLAVLPRSRDRLIRPRHGKLYLTEPPMTELLSLMPFVYTRPFYFILFIITPCLYGRWRMWRCVCGMPLSDSCFVLALTITTIYSAHSFYTYLFPETFSPVASHVEAFLRWCFAVLYRADGASTSTSSSASPALTTLAPLAPPPTAELSKKVALKFRQLRLDSVAWRWPLLLISIFLFVMFVWAYYMAVTTPPGAVPRAFHQHSRKSAALAIATFFEPLPFPAVRGAASTEVGPLHRARAAYPDVPRRLPATHIRIFPVGGGEASTSKPEEEEEFFFNPRANSYTSLNNRYLNFCPMCTTYKPPRAHHCSHCHRCILRYDHHCPWLGQCVGFYNYKNFLLLLLYTWLLTGWVLVLLIAARIEFSREYRLLKEASGKVLTDAQIQEWAALGQLNVGKPFLGVYVCAVQAAAFFLMSSILLKRHILLARRNVTTIDVVISQRKEEQGKGVSPTGGGSGEDEDEEDGCTSAALTSSSFDGSDASPLVRASRKNVYDLGVRRNLLQIFGDAKVHRKGQPHQTYEECRCYQEYLETDEFEHPQFLKRWLWRLIPTPAYPPQRQWEHSGRPQPASASPQRFTSPIRPDGAARRNYGSISPPVEGPGSRGADSILHQFQATEEHLLGLRFPTRTSLGAEPHPGKDIEWVGATQPSGGATECIRLFLSLLVWYNARFRAYSPLSLSLFYFFAGALGGMKRSAFCLKLLASRTLLGPTPPDFASLLSQQIKPMQSGDRFDGNFCGSPGFLDTSLLANMQQTLRANMTPEMKESMEALLQGSDLTNGSGMKMGVMAFGMGENERGKKVARAAKMSVDLETGKMEKDFVEQQMEPDDVSLPKDTVESYDTEGAMEVEFVEDAKPSNQ